MFNPRVLVTGGRKYKDAAKVYKCLDYVYNRRIGVMTLIEGGATGADRHAADWAEAHPDVNHIQEEAEWDRYGKSAGYRRNKVMAKLEPDVCFAFPGGDGTANMVELCEEFKIKVIKVT